MSTVTLVGARLAEPGQEFVYQGEADACEGCPYRSQCLNLAEGTRYEVTDVGTTSVPDPDWLDAARAQGSGAGS